MNNFKVGFSTVNTNPPLGIPMMGYYVERNAKGFLDDLQVKTLVIEANDKKIAIISVDVVSIQEATYVKYVEAIETLMSNVDEWIPTPERDNEKPFLMSIEDVFTITGRGTVVTGRVERGQLKLNDEVEIVGLKETKKTVVTGIEMFRKSLDYAESGDNAGILLRGVSREEVERGQVLAKPGTVTPHTKFKAQVYVLSKEEGGRHTPFFSNYRPQFYFRTTDVTGVIELPAGVEMVMPGDNVEMTVELIAPIAIEAGTKFSIREGGRTVGSGNISEIIK